CVRWTLWLAGLIMLVNMPVSAFPDQCIFEFVPYLIKLVSRPRYSKLPQLDAHLLGSFVNSATRREHIRFGRIAVPLIRINRDPTSAIRVVRLLVATKPVSQKLGIYKTGYTQDGTVRLNS